MGSTRYDVILHGFPGGTPNGDPPVVALAAAFGLAPRDAERFVVGLPKVVKHAAEPSLASRYEQVLRGIGASVEVRPTEASRDVQPLRPDATFRPGSIVPPAEASSPASRRADTRSGLFGVAGGDLSAADDDPAPSQTPARSTNPLGASSHPAWASPPVNEPAVRPAQPTPGGAVLSVGGTVADTDRAENSGLAWDEAFDGPDDDFTDGPAFDPDAPFELAASRPGPAPPVASPPPVEDPLSGLASNDPTQSSIGGHPMFTSPSGLEIDLPATSSTPRGRSAKLPAIVPQRDGSPRSRATHPSSAIPDRVPRSTAPPTSVATLELVEDRVSTRSDTSEPAEVGTPISGVRAVPREPLGWLDEASGRTAPEERRPGRISPVAATRFTGLGFGASIPVALLMPLSAGGLKWLAITSAAALLFGALSMFAAFLFIFGFLLILIGAASLLTLNAFCFQAFMAAAADDADEPFNFPDIVDWKAELAFPGLIIMFWFVAAMVPLGVWTSGLGGTMGDPVGVVLAFAPMLLWPMAATVACVDGSFAGLFQFPRVLAGIARAPLRYLAVIAIGVMSGVVVMVASQLVIGGGFLSLLLGALLMNAGFAYGNGVMGAMMGRLVATHPDVLEE